MANRRFLKSLPAGKLIAQEARGAASESGYAHIFLSCAAVIGATAAFKCFPGKWQEHMAAKADVLPAKASANFRNEQLAEIFGPHMTIWKPGHCVPEDGDEVIQAFQVLRTHRGRTR
ncbi:hypothetical protein [Bradyrhizobium sp. 6(2017)]|uniref:hypothetical protein n=1 Tax=Bradyrhizobium sp. 6(2017) TaxID=1197460 RepID=UPI0013E19490|nr:hypothetical protein [Bradyrhizobium sp. 6(2017)]QIG91072.1 hypothetical protein G6P99_00055 [Bradyrhizobium sp. 6(2017)]